MTDWKHKFLVKTIENFILNNGYNFTDIIDKNQINALLLLSQQSSSQKLDAYFCNN